MTHSELYQFAMLLIGVITLVYTVTKDRFIKK